jgi:hypothetical protein
MGALGVHHHRFHVEEVPACSATGERELLVVGTEPGQISDFFDQSLSRLCYGRVFRHLSLHFPPLRRGRIKVA